MSSMQAVVAAFKGFETLTKAAVDPKEVGESLAKFGLSSVLATAAQNLGPTKMNASAIDFRAKHLREDV